MQAEIWYLCLNKSRNLYFAYNFYYNDNCLNVGEVDLVEDFDNKELIRTYKKNGFTVKAYKSIMTDKERVLKDARIKHDILNIIKDLTITKKENIAYGNKLAL